ncbi:unnamed protein product, partial [Rotaria socialis]
MKLWSRVHAGLEILRVSNDEADQKIEEYLVTMTSTLTSPNVSSHTTSIEATTFNILSSTGCSSERCSSINTTLKTSNGNHKKLFTID